jgi:N-acetylmuramoyl-L-alanine amidase
MKKKTVILIIVGLVVGSLFSYYFIYQDQLEESEAATPSFWSLSPTTRLMARTISAEARGEPFVGQVAVGAVIMNRVRSSRFPDTISGVIYQPWAFTAVAYGHIWNHTPGSSSVRAAISASNGWDPTYGSIYYYNPAGVSTYSREVVRRIGKHIFAR